MLNRYYHHASEFVILRDHCHLGLLWIQVLCTITCTQSQR